MSSSADGASGAPRGSDVAPDPNEGPTFEPRRISRGAVAILAVVAVAVPGVGLALALRNDSPSSADGDGKPGITADVGARVDEEAPAFTLVSIDGDEVSLDDYRGRPLLVTFWASWCRPCRQEFPLLRDALVEHPDEFAVLGVMYEDLEKDARAFMVEVGADWPALEDPDGRVARSFGVAGIPQTFFIDGDGILRERAFGITAAEDLEGPLGRLLER